jgi:anti-sigma-K factor RskA
VPVPSRFVAVLQSSPDAPAFIMTVDLAQRSLTVRRVSAEEQAGKSYELWLVSDKYPAPRSLGLIGTREFTQVPALQAYDRNTIENATFAVSLEPEGGSPTGVATGPVLFSGKLLEAVPPTRSP